METSLYMLYFMLPVSIIMIFCGYLIFRGDRDLEGGAGQQPPESSTDPSDLQKTEKERLQILEQIFPSQSSSTSSSNDGDEERARVLVHDDATKRYEWQPKTDTNVTSKDCSICLEDFDSAREIVTPVCSHSYHRSCILNWVTKKHDTCPTCRTIMWDSKEYDRLANDLKEADQITDSEPQLNVQC